MSEQRTRMGVIAAGNAFDGLTLYGPFPLSDCAVLAEKTFGSDSEWHVVIINQDNEVFKIMKENLNVE